jgi:hypothetical protein
MKIMNELFEFEVHKKDSIITESYIEQFIKEFLDRHSLFWGGGYDFTKINGVISTDDNSLDITSIINDFVNYFSEDDQILINLYSRWFNKINHSTLNNHGNLKLTKIKGLSN